ncbi:hypothetical protein HNQ07_002934 [Deinococcus metalli]|uniref:Uncharacterized protein n=1 Tax=Deinococcus metalli TaxID=1141878 RepID=A0A7W8KFV0_9DEIO|nr:hypothetical protein [Deinococcus metalli]MBB5377442.1 hypothetical protein [Deinococcus metalli]GHF50438.1 hypothetical protein GCM10017781_28700 [Deinococcus metalli]
MGRKPRTHLIDRSEFYEITGRLQHYACFHCRKAFKQRLHDRGEEVPCPQCRQPMTNMGTDFKAPPHRDQEQWLKAERLARAGIRFFPTWQEGTPGDRPATLAEVPAFLRRTFPPSAGQTYLEREPSTTSSAPREGRLEQQGHFPRQAYRLLGRPLETGSAVELFERGHWQPITFIGRGSGNAPIPQPFAYPRVDDRTYFNRRPLFLTGKHRLRWPE